jgi:hypothetical protein
MPFHFCADEMMMIMAMVPFIGVGFRRMHAWYHLKFKHHCHKSNCNKEHLDHK